MPELPEVETTKRKLEPLLKGKRILNLPAGRQVWESRKVLKVERRYYKARLVYQRAGEKCKRRGAIIKRIKVASRGTFICEKCQRLFRR
ncbi:hypothetical protein A2757_02735 [Candidatus Giovannonibacteria bacterium RIFCSPHIGHO2_01_FULL_48_47]|nr:MAG: hypothetical protein A2757_02735 [Candidatus Giovannonibacteria bacterium RIFCSPHIGHO2_01_FULL_48_47]OGF67613.1 MAG: hypothetical protein A3D61_01895 [Candidatus Giovannonibacteria bacterium RIFCSPHIGHO2_02_FULL_48_15]OGF88179.1 MAG: hypothetical protein A3B26_00525 [Candidatus Giovannonibacteria bacterium RIFCSPLOWO2_01_FULL_48_47]OGF95438.1 MAG: hypothetical protein A2433_00785 [Candidatus Giovannonibacteria bacterium RIFOXYC1_FULL_48_8]OGF95987.1 MAG: hypothetical protein A2613_00220